MSLSKKITIIVCILCIFGIIMVYSSSYIWAEYKFDNPYRYALYQLCYFIFGFFVMRFVSKIDYNIYKNKANLILGICFSLLVLVLIPFIGTVRNGSRSWFGIGPFGIQPSELSKIGLVIFTSLYLAKNNSSKRQTASYVLPIFLVILIFFAVIMLEPDFGTGMVIVFSLMILIIVTGTNLSLFVKLGFLGLLGIIALIAVAPYRLERITSFLNPWSDPLGSGFQIIQSLYAIGPGGLFGQGFLNSRQKHFYLPEPQTDFIFSIIVEEFGIFGCIFVCILFALLFYYCIKIALNTDNLFGKYVVFGFSFMLIVQTLLNLMVVVGLVPVTGVTLPFLSYGGSSLLVSMASIGIILNISKNSK